MQTVNITAELAFKAYRTAFPGHFAPATPKRAQGSPAAPPPYTNERPVNTAKYNLLGSFERAAGVLLYTSDKGWFRSKKVRINRAQLDELVRKYSVGRHYKGANDASVRMLYVWDFYWWLIRTLPE